MRANSHYFVRGQKCDLYSQYLRRAKFKSMSKIIHRNVKKNFRIQAQKLLALDKGYIRKPLHYDTPSWGASSSAALKQRAYQSKRLKTDTRQKLCLNGLDNTKSIMR